MSDAFEEANAAGWWLAGAYQLYPGSDITVRLLLAHSHLAKVGSGSTFDLALLAAIASDEFDYTPPAPRAEAVPDLATLFPKPKFVRRL